METRETATRYGHSKKRNNALAAIVCGVLPAAWLAMHARITWQEWLAGLIVGLIWGNAFEYTYHRWLLHRPRSPLGAGHHRHHAYTGTPQEAEHVALISSPLNIVLLYIINGLPALLITRLTGIEGIVPGVFVGWMLYVILTEEIHWRIHMNGRLPLGLQFARAYHMRHHDTPNGRYNVFLPLFDFLLGNTQFGKSKLPV